MIALCHFLFSVLFPRTISTLSSCPFTKKTTTRSLTSQPPRHQGITPPYTSAARPAPASICPSTPRLTHEVVVVMYVGAGHTRVSQRRLLGPPGWLLARGQMAVGALVISVWLATLTLAATATRELGRPLRTGAESSLPVASESLGFSPSGLPQ